MQKTKTVDLKPFQEHTPEVQKLILDRYRDWNLDDEYYQDYVFDHWSSDFGPLEGTGLSYNSCSYSGFYSQGDGASLGLSIDDVNAYAIYLCQGDTELLRHVTRLIKWAPEYIEGASVKNNYSWSQYQKFDTPAIELAHNGDRFSNIRSCIAKLNKNAIELHNGLNRQIFKELQSEYEYLSSDECLENTFSDIDMLFSDFGKIEYDAFNN